MLPALWEPDVPGAARAAPRRAEAAPLTSGPVLWYGAVSWLGLGDALQCADLQFLDIR